MESRLQDQVGQSEIIPPANYSERTFGGVDCSSSVSLVSSHPQCHQKNGPFARNDGSRSSVSRSIRVRRRSTDGHNIWVSWEATVAVKQIHCHYHL